MLLAFPIALPIAPQRFLHIFLENTQKRIKKFQKSVFLNLFWMFVRFPDSAANSNSARVVYRIFYDFLGNNQKCFSLFVGFPTSFAERYIAPQATLVPQPFSLFRQRCVAPHKIAPRSATAVS